MTDFEFEDLVVGNGSASELQKNNASYMATITPAASGTVTMEIAAGAARDAGGNPSAAAVQFSIVADVTPGPALPVIGALALALLLLGGGATAVLRPVVFATASAAPVEDHLAPCSSRGTRSPRRGTRPPPRGSPGGPCRQAASPATPAFGGVGRTDGPPLPVSLVAVALSPEPRAWGEESGQRSIAHVVHPARNSLPLE